MSGSFPKPGEIFNERYHLLEVLGSGGIGTVFKATQMESDRIIALKVLHEQILVDEDFKKRFIKEARALNNLAHLGIVKVYHVGISESGLPYIAMEFVKGNSLRQILSENSQNGISPLRASRIIRQIAEALAHVHANNIVHRDIKPENIVIVNEPEPDTAKLIDFGLARFVDEQKSTKTGTLIGSVQYMSPEQCKGKQVDKRSDIYSLAICLHELVAGRPPFDADTPVGIMYQHMNQTIPPISTKSPSRHMMLLNELIARGTAKQESQRFQSMEEFSSALSNLIESMEKKPDGAPNSGTHDNRGRGQSKVPITIACIGLAFLALVFGLNKLTTDGKQTQNTSNKYSGITLSEANILIRKLEPGNLDDLAMLNHYLENKISNIAAEASLLLARSAMIKDDSKRAEKLSYAKRALELSKKTTDHFLLAQSAFNYAQCLFNAKNEDECLELCIQMCQNRKIPFAHTTDLAYSPFSKLIENEGNKANFLLLISRIMSRKGNTEIALDSLLQAISMRGFEKSNASYAILELFKTKSERLAFLEKYCGKSAAPLLEKKYIDKSDSLLLLACLSDLSFDKGNTDLAEECLSMAEDRVRNEGSAILPFALENLIVTRINRENELAEIDFRNKNFNKGRMRLAKLASHAGENLNDTNMQVFHFYCVTVLIMLKNGLVKEAHELCNTLTEFPIRSRVDVSKELLVELQKFDKDPCVSNLCKLIMQKDRSPL